MLGIADVLRAGNDRWDECLLRIADVRSSKNGFANSHVLQSLLFDSASLNANTS